MIDRIFRALFPEPKSNLEVVLEKISKQEEVRSATIVLDSKGKNKKINIDSHLNFMVGKVNYSIGMSFDYFSVRFGDNNTKCIVVAKNSDEPLFMFDNLDEVKQIRKAVTDKYCEMIRNNIKFNMSEFLKM